jgi:hypothetical protein
MEISRQLDDLSTALESNKITTRRHACDDLSELLGRKSTVDFLNENDPDCWPRILSSIQSCIAKVTFFTCCNNYAILNHPGP